MTDLDVRKIAGILNEPWSKPDLRHSFTNIDVAALLDALVEEKRRYLVVKHHYTPQASDPKIKDDDSRYIQALRELGLEGVWPVKEKR